MATTMTPPTVAPKASSGELRFVPIRAHLMPNEIISDRQALVVRKRVIVGLIAVVVVLIGAFTMSWWQTRSANGDLATAQRQGVALQSQQNQFSPLVRAQAEITSVQTQLQKLMVGDLSWHAMLTTLRAKAPSGVELSNVSGTVTAGGGTGGPAGVVTAPDPASILNDSGSAAVGELSITGTAPDKRTVAAYADALATVQGLTAPLISNIQASIRPVTFTITVVITSASLGGRYVSTPTTNATTTGGH